MGGFPEVPELSAYPRWKALGPVFLSFSSPHLFQVPQTEGPSGVHWLTPLLCPARRRLRCREGPVGDRIPSGLPDLSGGVSLQLSVAERAQASKLALRTLQTPLGARTQ